ncbi:MAG: polysaccharide biosynthesis tyrosine autokinase [Deltaproteobacteria bacterium]|nr:polysaccharide biosynthesis tyrosine autokinase [Deltaproteobacteria bacterium]MCB9785451.1 polysaccharide biosynthesis tyrosine autokinase [Deltaproteobacteria bacterium]
MGSQKEVRAAAEARGGADAWAALDEPAAEGPTVLGQLGSILQIILRHKLLILGVTAVGVAAGWFWVERQVPIYRATSKVMIDLRAPKILSNVNEVVELGTPRFYGTDHLYFESQYQIIRGRDVAEKVLDKLQLWQSEHLLGLDAASNDMSGEEKRQALAEANLAEVLSERIEVAPVKNSMMVAIHFEDPDPKFAIEVVNAVAEAYKDQNLEQKRGIVADATKELGSLVDDWEARRQGAEDAVRTFELEHNVGTIPTTKKAIDERLATLEQQLTAARVERIRLEAQSRSLEKFRGTKDVNLVDAAPLLEDAVIRELKQQIAEHEAKLAGLEGRYLEQHPEVIGEKAHIAALRRSVRAEIHNVAKSVQRELRRVTDVEGGLQAEVEKAREEERKIADIERDYARLVEVQGRFATQAESVKNRHIETMMSAQVETNNIRVLDRATSAIQVRPRKAMAMAVALLLAMALAFALAFALEFADSTIKDWHDLSERLGHKVLGVLPVIGDDEAPPRKPGAAPDGSESSRDFFIHDNPRSQVAEAFRALRTNLLFMSTATPIKSLLITSADPSEGKSTIAISTAISMAMSGSRVLLVEADMRRPRFALSLGLDSTRGLTACLAGNDPVTRHTQTTAIPGFEVLVCGPIPPNPAELLHTKRFAEVKAEMEAEFDLVIFDSPPVNAVADALVLGSQVDGCLVVVRAARTTRHALRHAVRQLRGVDIYVLGTVLNHRETPRMRYYGTRYGYGAGYGYGYGYGYAQPYGGKPEGEGSS